MTSPFDPLRDPTRWRIIKREFPHGAHQKWIVERMCALILFDVNDFVLDLELRTSPRLALIGRAKAKKRALTVTDRGIVRRRLRVEFDETGVLLGDSHFGLDDEEGVMRLVNALVDCSEAVWNSQGR